MELQLFIDKFFEGSCSAFERRMGFGRGQAKKFISDGCIVDGNDLIIRRPMPHIPSIEIDFSCSLDRRFPLLTYSATGEPQAPVFLSINLSSGSIVVGEALAQNPDKCLIQVEICPDILSDDLVSLMDECKPTIQSIVSGYRSVNEINSPSLTQPSMKALDKLRATLAEPKCRSNVLVGVDKFACDSFFIMLDDDLHSAAKVANALIEKHSAKTQYIIDELSTQRPLQQALLRAWYDFGRENHTLPAWVRREILQSRIFDKAEKEAFKATQG